MQAENVDTGWRRSSHCEPLNCVETTVTRGRVLVRDSGGPGTAVLGFAYGAWREFVTLASTPRGERIS
ncbi:DUF397 domain-containing protein [Streptomyces spiramenti]